MSRKVLLVAIAAGIALGGLHRVDAEPGLTSKGRPVLRGYVHNRSAFHVDRVRLRVDSVGGAGAATAPVAMGWVNGEIEANGRRYFEVAVPRADAAYRVSVESFEVRFNDLNG